MNYLSLHECVLNVLSYYGCPIELQSFFYYVILIIALIFDFLVIFSLVHFFSILVKNLLFGKLKHCLFYFDDGFIEYRLCFERRARSKKFVYKYIRKKYTTAELREVICFDSFEQLSTLGSSCLSAKHYYFIR